ncbi:MAG TPA: hypothetical protein VK213_04980 [Bacteroidales bacterium]|nr:hypothetical protein [Bacteroidales bacterium]
MKKLTTILGCLMIITIGLKGEAPSTDSLQVLCTAGLGGIADNWAREYASLSGATIRVSVMEVNAIAAEMQKGVIVFTDGDEIEKISPEGSVRFVVGRDIIVPVVNSENPYAGEILSRGIPAGKLAEAIKNSEKANWEYLIGSKDEIRANLLFKDDGIVKSRVALFAGTDGNRITGDLTVQDLMSEINRDRNSIAFVKLADIQKDDGTIMNGIKLMPIDRNNNGALDFNENIYTDMTSFTRGVWIGKYPKELCLNIYCVSNSLPGDEDATAFLNWLLGDGQKFVSGAGMTALIQSEKMSYAGKLSALKATESSVPGEKSILGRMLLALVGLIIAFFLIDYLFRSLRRKPVNALINAEPGTPLKDLVYNLPAGMYFDKTHTWAFMEQAGSVKVGIDDFILHMTGPLSRINLKKEGDRVRRGEEILSLVQNGKKLTLYSPVSGTIREKNSELENDASLVSNSPYNYGWVYKIEPENWQRENQLLFMAEKQKKFIAAEIARIKDMIASIVNAGQPQYAMVLQDGGMLHDGVLAQLGPEVWEEFQQKIIDPSRQVWFYEIF